MTDFERVGGEEALSSIVDEFIERVSRDSIIGFFFEGRDLGRIRRQEYELAAERMGGPVRYSGRPLSRAHAHLKINRGHLRRRLAILSTVLLERGVDAGVAERWIEHERGLEAEVTTGRDCPPEP